MNDPKPENPMPASDLRGHVRAVARSLGTIEPTDEDLQAVAGLPVFKRFERLLAEPPGASARDTGGGPPASVVGDEVLRSLLVTLLGCVAQAEAVNAARGLPPTPLVVRAREANRWALTEPGEAGTLARGHRPEALLALAREPLRVLYREACPPFGEVEAALVAERPDGRVGLVYLRGQNLVVDLAAQHGVKQFGGWWLRPDDPGPGC